MFSSIDPTAQQFLNSMNTIQSRLSITQQQISSGLKVNQASDAPDQLSPILQLHAQIQQNQDIQTNLGLAKANTDTGESALSNAVNLLQSASVLATQAMGADQSADTRATLAQSVETLQEQMVNVSQTTANGIYVFGGDQNQTPSYQLDLNAATGVDRLQLAGATALAQGIDGQQFATGLSANTIFDHRDASDNPAPDNVFAAMNGLRTALLANNSAGITSAISSLQTASTYMNSQLAFYGQAQDRVAAATSDAQNQSLALKSQLSGLQDADLTDAITALTAGQTQMQATLSARARMSQTTLFDVLPITTG